MGAGEPAHRCRPSLVGSPLESAQAARSPSQWLYELLAELRQARGCEWQRRRLVAELNALLAELTRRRRAA
jgi:hypothetical protein